MWLLARSGCSIIYIYNQKITIISVKLTSKRSKNQQQKMEMKRNVCVKWGGMAIGLAYEWNYVYAVGMLIIALCNALYSGRGTSDWMLSWAALSCRNGRVLSLIFSLFIRKKTIAISLVILCVIFNRNENEEKLPENCVPRRSQRIKEVIRVRPNRHQPNATT